MLLVEELVATAVVAGSVAVFLIASSIALTAAMEVGTLGLEEVLLLLLLSLVLVFTAWTSGTFLSVLSIAESTFSISELDDVDVFMVLELTPSCLVDARSSCVVTADIICTGVKYSKFIEHFKFVSKPGWDIGRSGRLELNI